jgi:protein disulfide-isomerase A6
VEDYQGGRTAKAIVDAVIDKIPNHVKRVTDKQFDEFLENGNDTAKAILFTDKGTTSALLRAVAIDFLGSVSIAQVRNSQKEAVESFGITEFPTLVLLPGGNKEGLVYEGEMKKDSIVAFLSQAAEPNPDPAPADSKPSKKAKASSKEPKKASKSEDPPASSKTSEAPDSTQSADPENLEEDTTPPVIIPEEPPTLKMLEYAPALEEACLDPKSTTCVLVLLAQKPLDNPDAPLTEEELSAISTLAQIQAKREQKKAKLFPFYSVANMNSAGLRLRRFFKLDKEIFKTEIVAINMKRNWWRHYTGDDFSEANLEDWIDRIRIGDAKRYKMPDALYPPPEPEEEPAPIEVGENAETTAEEKSEEKAEKVEEKSHDEL